MKLTTTVAAAGGGSASIVGLLVSQTSPATAAWLQEYGPWAICVILGGVVAVLFRLYVEQRDKHELAVQALNDKHVVLFEKVITTINALPTKRISGPTDIRDKDQP